MSFQKKRKEEKLLSLKLRKYGDWARAGAVLRGLCTNITPAFTAKLREDGELILDTLRGHIDNQDLNWVPLSENTIELKGGDATVYVETGFLRDNLKVRKVRSSSKGVSFFIGADAWTTTPEGEKFSDLMIWLEYGTDKIPPRPLIRPTWEEIEPIIKKHWKEILQDLVDTGGVVK